MKRILILIFAVLLVSCLFGCHYNDGGDILEPVEFYYPRTTEAIVYGSDNGVIAAEIREASGHTKDLNYLLSMYTRGPLDSGFRSPFPDGCRPLDVYIEEDCLYIRLSSSFTTLENLELTTACAALAKTGLRIAGTQYISIHSESTAKTVHAKYDAESFCFADNATLVAAPEAE